MTRPGQDCSGNSILYYFVHKAALPRAGETKNRSSYDDEEEAFFLTDGEGTVSYGDLW